MVPGPDLVSDGAREPEPGELSKSWSLLSAAVLWMDGRQKMGGETAGKSDEGALSSSAPLLTGTRALCHGGVHNGYLTASHLQAVTTWQCPAGQPPIPMSQSVSPQACSKHLPKKLFMLVFLLQCPETILTPR